MTSDDITEKRSQISVGEKIEAVYQLTTFVELCASGLYQGAEASEWVPIKRAVARLMKKPDLFPSDQDYQKAINQAKELEDFSKSEIEHDFPYLHGIASIRLWSILEAMVDDLSVALLLFNPKCRDLNFVRQLKGPLVDFALGSESERARHLANLVKQEVKAPLKLGTGRFEAVLNELGVGGPVEPEVKCALLELSQIRHVIVHCNGKADLKLIESCPWLHLKEGQEVHINRGQFRKFNLATYWYIIEVERRLVKLGLETRSEYANEFQALTLQWLREANSISATTSDR